MQFVGKSINCFHSVHLFYLQVVEKELLIQEKEKLYMELKQILQRQPGPEVAEQLQIYQQTLKEKTKQMKVCISITILSLNSSPFNSALFPAGLESRLNYTQ